MNQKYRKAEKSRKARMPARTNAAMVPFGNAVAAPTGVGEGDGALSMFQCRKDVD